MTAAELNLLATLDQILDLYDPELEYLENEELQKVIEEFGDDFTSDYRQELVDHIRFAPTLLRVGREIGGKDGPQHKD